MGDNIIDVSNEISSEPSITMETIQEHFDEAKEGIITLLEAGKRQVKRIDTIAYIKELYGEWFSKSEFDFIHVTTSVEHMVNHYEAMIDVVKKLKLEDFLNEWTDPFAAMLDEYAIEKVSSWEKAYEGMLLWQCIRPFGEKLEQLYSIVQREYSVIKED